GVELPRRLGIGSAALDDHQPVLFLALDPVDLDAGVGSQRAGRLLRLTDRLQECRQRVRRGDSGGQNDREEVCAERGSSPIHRAIIGCAPRRSQGMANNGDRKNGGMSPFVIAKHSHMAGYHIGIDIGGTFTDCFVTDAVRSWSAKAPTTPAALDEGLVESLRRAAEAAELDLQGLLRQTIHFGLGTTSV